MPDPPTLVRLKSRTASESVPLVAALKLASPLYTAVMAWLPAASEVVLRAATPLDRVPWPSGIVPSRKLTVPVGLVAVEDTVAVNRRGLVRTTELALLVKVTGPL